jgi:hypothetical protein
MIIKVFNKLPGFIADKAFYIDFEKYLNEKSFYSLEDFIND